MYNKVITKDPAKGTITSRPKIKHAIKLKTSPARLAQLLQPSLAFCFSLQTMTAHRLPKSLLLSALYITLLGRPEQPFRTGLCFTADVSFFSPRILRGPSTDRPETLPHDHNLAVVYNPTPKIRGEGRSPQKNWGPKTCKISVNFGPLQSLIANISGMAEDIQNRPTLQTMAIPPAFNEKSQVNFGPLTAWNYM